MDENSTKSEKSADPPRIRIAITGTGGRLGGALGRIYSEKGYEVVPFDRRSLDLSDADQIRAVLSQTAFDILINPAAMTSVDECEGEPVVAEAINSKAPEIMAEICTQNRARFIHVSTDYVFDGEEPGLRTEDEATRPLGVYGETKRAGELAAMEKNSTALVIRTSWVFGPERAAFPDSIISRALSGGPVEAIADKWSAPTYADDFARHLEPLFTKRLASGVLHLCNSGSCSWQEYGQAALDFAAESGLELPVRNVGALRLCDMKSFSVPRPIHTAMDTSRYGALGLGRPRAWREALKEYVTRQVAAGKFVGN